NLKAMMDRLGIDDSQPIESKMISRAVESAQKRVEGNNFDARKTVLSYDDVLREQREVIYKQRSEVIHSEGDLREIIEKMIMSSLYRVILTHTQDEDENLWNYEAMIEYIHGTLLDTEDISVNDIKGKEPEEIEDFVMEIVRKKYDEK